MDIPLNKFKKFLLRNELVTLETVELWEATSDNIEKSLIKYYDWIAWGRYAQVISEEPDTPPIYPLSHDHALCELNWDDRAEKLHQMSSLFISDHHGVLCIGLLNPFRQTDVQSYVAHAFPGKRRFLVTLTPSDYAMHELRIGRGDRHPEDWSFTGEEGNQQAFLVWSSNFLAMPAGSVTEGISLEKVDGCFLIKQSETWAWVATSDVPSNGLKEELVNVLHKKIHIIWTDTLSIKPPPQDDSQGMDENGRITEWPRTAGLGRDSEGTTLFNAILEAAVDARASDVSLEPKEGKDGAVYVRFRIDGDYSTQAPLSAQQYISFLDRCKLYGRMRPDKISVPQDGAGTFTYNNITHDLRFAICPTIGNNESLAIRIHGGRILKLKDLKLGAREQDAIEWYLKLGTGMYISTGPTGSGKTTTLYACLNLMSDSKRKIITLEEPVEKHFSPAVQIEIRETKGFTFPIALRSVMRQDPDTVMIGEIRDAESANIAVQVALTGHQVFSTVHAPDAVSVFERMVESFGISRLTLAYALRIIVAQRLIPKLCPYCRQTRPVLSRELANFPNVRVALPVIGEPVGCKVCRNTGILGVMSVMEILKVDEQIRSMIEEGKTSSEIRRHNEARGYQPIPKLAALLALSGEVRYDDAIEIMSMN